MAGPRAEDFRNFGIVAGPDSPLYGHVCEAIVGSPELLALAATSSEPMAEPLPRRDPRRAAARPRRRARRLLPDRRRRRARRTTGCAPRSSASARRARERLEETLATRRTQTNETARCVGAAAGVRRRRGRAPARADRDRGERGAQRAVGPLRLRLRRARRRAMPARRCGSRASCAAGAVPPLEPPPVAWRAGIDLSPVDLPRRGRRALAARLPVARPGRAPRAARRGAAGRARARAGRDPPRRRARAAARA